jgi:hypothetical protein
VGTAIHAGVAQVWLGAAKPVALEAAIDAYTRETAKIQEPDEKAVKEIADGLLQVKTCIADYDYGPSDFEKVESVEKELTIKMWDKTYLEGRLDRIVTHNGLPWIHDTKTTGMDVAMMSRIFRMKPQFRGYAFMYNETYGEMPHGLMIDWIKKPRIYHRKDGTYSTSGQAFHREPIPYTTRHMDEFGAWFHRISQSIMADWQLWTMEQEEDFALGREGIPTTAFPTNGLACNDWNRICPFFLLCDSPPKRFDQIVADLFEVRDERRQEGDTVPERPAVAGDGEAGVSGPGGAS